jgi:hypothetical protein
MSLNPMSRSRVGRTLLWCASGTAAGMIAGLGLAHIPALKAVGIQLPAVGLATGFALGLFARRLGLAGRLVGPAAAAIGLATLVALSYASYCLWVERSIDVVRASQNMLVAAHDETRETDDSRRGPTEPVDSGEAIPTPEGNAERRAAIYRGRLTFVSWLRDRLAVVRRVGSVEAASFWGVELTVGTVLAAWGARRRMKPEG